MERDILKTHQKALSINLHEQRYGTFAEIGAGQEVARWFFQVGGAAGTVAKSMSAYDMTFSDAIYGACERYVCEKRVVTMLEHEWSLLQERLGEARGDRTTFFVFADTVAARSYTRQNDCHGWLGVRFQTCPLAEPSQILLHVRMWDRENIAQQEALGVVGVNLIHAAFNYHQRPEVIVEALVDNLTTQRIEVDMLKFTGPAFATVDNRLMAVALVERSLTDAVFIGPSGVALAEDLLRKKPILLQRGCFRPFTLAHMDMIECARAQFSQEPSVQGKDFVFLPELPLNRMAIRGALDPADLIARTEMLTALGHTTMISKYSEYFRLSAFFQRFTQETVAFSMGMEELQSLFTENNYEALSGGILEALGRLFKSSVKLYLYPQRDPKTQVMITARNFQVAPNLRGLYEHLTSNRLLEPIAGYDEKVMTLHCDDLLSKIAAGDLSWTAAVPAPIADYIRSHKLYGIPQ